MSLYYVRLNRKEEASSFLDDLVKESEIYRYIHEPSSKSWKKEEFEIRDALRAMNLFRIKQQLPLVISVMRNYEDQALKTKHVRSILTGIENFHFSFTAIASQRSSAIVRRYFIHVRLGCQGALRSQELRDESKVLAKLPEEQARSEATAVRRIRAKFHGIKMLKQDDKAEKPG
jgi:hypothetical protein